MAESDRKPPTLKTIAALSGLAVPTVSRALSDAPDIGSKTKERVRQIAREIGYVPNRAGVRLKTGKTHVIALVLSTDHGIVNRTARLIASSAGALRDTRYHLNVTPYFPTEDPLTPVRYIVETRSADAIILNQTEPEDVRVRYLLDRNFPFATHGRTNWSDVHSYYDFDNLSFTHQAFDTLAARGRKSVLVVAPPPSQNYAREIREGAIEGAQANGISACVLDGATSDDSDDIILRTVVDKLRRAPEIDAILCSSTSAAMAAAAGIETVGRRVGTDVDLIGKETSRLLHLFRPKILTYFEDITKAGEFLARAAVKAVEEPDAPPAQKLELPDPAGFKTAEQVLQNAL